MTFADFALDASAERPLGRGRDVCYSVMGLAGETADVLDIAVEWALQPELPPARRLIRKLGYVEHYRALVYVDLARVPARTAMPRGSAGASDAATAMMVAAGRLVLLLKNGIFHEQWADDQVANALLEFDEARLTFYRQFDLEPEDIWLAHVAARAAIQQLVDVQRGAAAATPTTRRFHLTAIAGRR